MNTDRKSTIAVKVYVRVVLAITRRGNRGESGSSDVANNQHALYRSIAPFKSDQTNRNYSLSQSLFESLYLIKLKLILVLLKARLLVGYYLLLRKRQVLFLTTLLILLIIYQHYFKLTKYIATT